MGKMSRPDARGKREFGDHTVRVEVSMSSRFLGKINKHLEMVAEFNRSAWIRRACLKLIREEQEDLREK